MIISIHQPDYIPYLGYFYKIAQSDRFVFLDDCQFSNDNMHHWNKIKTPQGECRLKIPVDYKFGDSIIKVRTKDELGWKQKHLKSIEMNYRKSPYFEEVFPKFEELLTAEYKNLGEQNITINMWICNQFGFKTTFYRSSEIQINTVKEERVIEITKKLEGQVYISGNGARAYQHEEDFNEQGIKLVYTDYEPIEYKQLWGEFIPNLSILDIIFYFGFDWKHIGERLKEAIGSKI